MDRCFRCGGRGSEWHHRRSRSVVDQHVHCPCNGVLLCKTCHEWAHAHPFDARRVGLIVSRHAALPGEHAAESHFGVLLLKCTGRYEYKIEEDA